LWSAFRSLMKSRVEVNKQNDHAIHRSKTVCKHACAGAKASVANIFAAD
jgi:hypothetical protein